MLFVTGYNTERAAPARRPCWIGIGRHHTYGPPGEHGHGDDGDDDAVFFSFLSHTSGRGGPSSRCPGNEVPRAGTCIWSSRLCSEKKKKKKKSAIYVNVSGINETPRPGL